MTCALVLVDLQHDFLAAPDLQPTSDAVVARATTLLDECRRRGVRVVHVWTTIDPADDRRLPHWRAGGRWSCVSGTAGHEPPRPLRPRADEAIVHKTGFDAFAGGALDRGLSQQGCAEVIVAGVHLHACVRAVAAGCLDRGLRVVVAEDAVASDDPVHAAATRRWLADRCVCFLPVRAIAARLDGEAAPAALVHRSPRALDTVLFDVPIAGRAEVAEATRTAHAAWRTWRDTPAGVRYGLLERFAARIDDVAPALARQMAIDVGKPLAHGLEESRRAAAGVRDVVGRAAAGAVEPSEGSGSVHHRPHGVVALISPWNNPVAIPAGKIAPALAYGNTVVWKPAPAALGMAQRVLAMLRECGVPPDAVQLVAGDRTTAQHLALDPAVDAVTFTGSVAAGYDVQEICARRAVPLQAELGGNNAAIIWDDADLGRAAREVAWGAFGFAGQRCTANRRVIASRGLVERVWQALHDAAHRLTWCDPLEHGADLGPVIHEEKRDELRAQIERAESDGGAVRVARLFADRVEEPWARDGAYAQPVLAACDQPAHPLVQEESMGPLLVLQPADDFDHALSLLNGVRHGLAAALFSERADLQQRFLADARAGIVKLNSSTAGVDVRLPFGGWKASGVGPPEHGIADRMFFTRLQAVYT